MDKQMFENVSDIEEELKKYSLPDINDSNFEVKELLHFIEESLGVTFEIHLTPTRKCSLCYPKRGDIFLGKDVIESCPAAQWITVVHEAIHVTGLHHNYKSRKFGYYSLYEDDIYSAKKTNDMIKSNDYYNNRIF